MNLQAPVHLFERRTGALVGAGPRSRDALREEYDYVDARLAAEQRILDWQCQDLARREAALLEARDLAWLDESSGTSFEQQRLFRSANSVGESPLVQSLVQHILSYQRKHGKASWQRPALEDWQRLTSAARQVIDMAGRAEAQALLRKRSEVAAASRSLEQMRARRYELAWLLRDELLPDIATT